jgi:hypothetical protein
MLYRVLPLTAALALFVGVAAAADKDKPADTNTGTVVSYADGKLAITDDKGKDATLVLTKDTKITCDGKDCTMDDLKAAKNLKDATVTYSGTKEKPEKVEIKTKKEKDKEEKKDKK